MTIVGCRFEFETLTQVELARQWMAARNVLVLDIEREPFLRRQLEQLAPKAAIQPERARGPRGAA